MNREFAVLPGWTMAVLAMAWLFAGVAFAGDGSRSACVPGERLTFQLRWLFVPAGEAELSVMPLEDVDGITACHFVLTVRSNDFIDHFYKVRDRIDAWAESSLARSLRYEKSQLEGKRHREEKVVFDWKAGVARYTNFGKGRPPVSLAPGTLDPLSAFFYVRSLDLSANLRIYSAISDGKKCVVGLTDVVGEEIIQVAGKSWKTWLLEPDLKHVGGVFEKSPNAKIQIWVTADERRIPVKLASRVIVGEFVGELVSIDGEPAPTEKQGPASP